MKNKQSFFSEKNSVVQNTTTPEIARFGGPVVILEPVIDRFEIFDKQLFHNFLIFFCPRRGETCPEPIPIDGILLGIHA